MLVKLLGLYSFSCASAGRTVSIDTFINCTPMESALSRPWVCHEGLTRGRSFRTKSSMLHCLQLWEFPTLEERLNKWWCVCPWRVVYAVRGNNISENLLQDTGHSGPCLWSQHLWGRGRRIRTKSSLPTLGLEGQFKLHKSLSPKKLCFLPP